MMTNDYKIMPVSEEIKRKYMIAQRGEEFYMIELGAFGNDADGYGIFRIQDPKVRDRLSEVVPISEFDPAQGIPLKY